MGRRLCLVLCLGAAAQAFAAPAAPAGDAAPAAGAPRTVTLRAVGDIVFGRHHDGVLLRFVAGEQLFAATRELLQGADLAFANLETPIVEGPDVLPGGGRGGVVRRGIGWMRFRADPPRARALADAGFDLVSTANNHAYDFGSDGLGATVRHLREAGLQPMGSGSDPAAPHIVEKNGLKIGFLAATLVSNRKDPDLAELAYVEPGAAAETLGARVRALRPRCDALVVSLHWGVEYNQAANAGQTALAHKLVDAGADLILGHHPHVVQGLERYQGAVIIYSLGNFVFDMAAPVKRESLMLEVTFSAGSGRPTVTARALPLLIDSLHVPAPPPAERARAIRESWIKLARRFQTALVENPDGSLTVR